ncbi:hypothetical protein FE251_00655 [Georgenia wutianyii]|uniref:Zinc finger CGNR domain-containing protein n=1 Tax=Georgenia wutianyii TaxID=2585135 RepID=A0ABX5VJU8_9MICO|nr:CGNR zinc finger domain-containing protein [Georgenia wutianyii]QDB78058.1 hypothetical protein FE251_00655 [Georgenia wutianyii]
MDVVTRADEDLLLDLLNTTPVVAGSQVDELLGPDAGRWAADHGGTGAPAEVTALREARDAMQAVVSGEAQASSLAPLLAQVAVRPRWQDGALTWEVSSGDGSTLAARALLAWAAVTERSPERLRPCANPECCRFLLDRSNANAARWCSMALCGNRAKARRHYRRSRAGDADGTAQPG